MANVYPNNSTYDFCQWIINSKFAHFTNARKALINTVGAASLAGTSVTQNQWNQFIDITNRVYFPYTQNLAQTQMTTWTDYSATSIVVGWSAFTRKNIWYAIVANNLYVMFDIFGTSNSVTTTITLPRNSNASTPNTSVTIAIVNNGATGQGNAGVSSNSNVMTFYKDNNFAAFTNTGNKLVQGLMIIALP